jgi:cell division protein FtsZ
MGTTRGLGAGGDPELGREAAEDDREKIAAVVKDCDLVFILAGMGGGTGGGASPVVAEIAAEQGALVIAFVTLPFSFEGGRRLKQAEEGLAALRRACDAVIPLPNDILLQEAADNETVLDSFARADEWIGRGVKSIWSMLSKTGLINVDFATLRQAFQQRGAKTLFGLAEGTGENAAAEAIASLKLCPLLHTPEFSRKADRLLVNITGGTDLTLPKVNEIMSAIAEQFGRDSHIIMGAVIDEGMQGRVEISFWGRATWDFSRLDANRPSRIVGLAGDESKAVRQICELVRQAAANHEHVAVSGAQHSMGGHSLYPGGVVLDMTGLHGLHLDPERTLLTAGAGARWSEILPFLDHAGRSVAIMQSNNDFTVGGSVSVNCHGWQFGAAPIASSVESFRIVDSAGQIVRCSRRENPRLFALALGGYGLFGVILDVTLRVVPNEEYRISTFRTRPSHYVADYERLTQGEDAIGMAYGRISVAPGSFLTDAMIVLFKRLPGTAGKADTLQNKEEVLKRAVFRASVGSPMGKEIRWTLETLIGGENGRLPVARNQILNDPSDWFANRDPRETEILHEYFIPPDRLGDFLARARAILRLGSPDLLNITVRYVREDRDTALPYARENVFGLVMLFNQGKTRAEEIRMRQLTRSLINEALACRGTYYLPYRPHATLRQFALSYPRSGEFFAEKRRLDPGEVFSNQFYLNYGGGGHSSPPAE